MHSTDFKMLRQIDGILKIILIFLKFVISVGDGLVITPPPPIRQKS